MTQISDSDVDSAGDGVRLARKLAGRSAEGRLDVLLDLVVGHAAAALNRADAGLLGSQESFKDLGFDSLTAVQFRNTLAEATGLSLPATLVFDYPTPADLAEMLVAELLPGADSGAAADPGAGAPSATEPATEPDQIADLALDDLVRLALGGTDPNEGEPR